VTDDLVVDARPALCWLDAFPWIEAAAGDAGFDDGGAVPWWLQPIDEPGSRQRGERLARVSDLALERRARWTIGQIFPGLSSDTVLSDLSFDTRARNALVRFGYRVAGDLEGSELAEIIGWRQVGIGTVDSLLQGLGDAATGSAAPVLLPPPEVGGARHRHSHETDGELTSWGESLVEDLRLIASWYVTLGTPAHPLLGGDLASGTPAEIIKARERLELINAGDVLDQSQVELDAAELLRRSIGALDGRAQEILARRFFADQPEKLDELARLMGVTRERVRQIEAKARANMVEFLEPGGTLELIGAAARELVGTVLPLDDLLNLLPALARPVEAVGQPAWRVLDRLDDAYEIEDGWCVSPTMLGAQTVTQARLQELADQYGVVRLEDIGALNANQSHEESHRSLGEWLRYCGYVLDGDFVFTRTQSVGDRAASILSIVGSPLSSQEILDRFDTERSPRSLKNALSIDDRFERVDRDRWALAEWDMESYTGVRALVREEVTRGGGQIAMDVLIERITGKYSVTASSVMAYASSPPFKAKGGIVRLAAADSDVRKSPERTRRLYRRGDAWWYRVKITKDHLRGSGSVAPMAIAGILDIQYGQTRLLGSALGPQSINWTGNQPAFGTIRRFLIADDIAIDSEVFLVIGDEGTFRTETVAPATGEPLVDALALVGATDEQADHDPRLTLAAAIGLPEDSPAASIIGGYRERGDSDVADLLVSVKSQLAGAVIARLVPSAEINEIMDLL
jgi:Sigma-70, region 4